MGQQQNTVVHRGVSTLEIEKRVFESVDVVAAVDLKIADKRSDFRMACRGDVENKRKAGRAGDADVKRAARVSSGLTRSAAARRLHGHDDDAFISPTTSIPGRASVRDRIDTAKGMAVRQAIQLKLYTTRSLKRDETAGYIRLVRASGEGDPDSVMRDADCDGLEGDRSPIDSATYGSHPVDDFSD